MILITAPKMEYCVICKDQIQLSHWLPCNHEFCYICIRRHLENRNFCPICLKYPLSLKDLKTNEKIISNIKRPISLFKITLSTLKTELKKFRVRTDGPFDRLKWRYNELCLQIDNDRYKEIPRSIDTIARQLHLFEINLFDRKHDLDKIYENLIELKQNFKNKKVVKEDDLKESVDMKEAVGIKEAVNKKEAVNIKDTVNTKDSVDFTPQPSKSNNLLRYFKKVDR